MAETVNTIREHREALGLSQGRLSERVAVSRQTINALETGRFDPSLPLALKLAGLFGVAVEELFRLARPPGRLGGQ